ARRAALHLLKHRETALAELVRVLERAAADIRRCSRCNNLDDVDPCWICTSEERDPRQILVVENVDDLWAMERTGLYKGRYHVLGGTLSALDGIGPDDLGIDRLLERLAGQPDSEVILATSATVSGQMTAHYIAERLQDQPVTITRFGRGVPVGGELNYLDEGTLEAAFTGRQPVG
ncbi:MAG: recombination mediator RecR, partial [Geminicoccaceae bacterium]|nr:recombination mediator RecR [Geminicoccaceae bacterium]